MTKDGRLHLLFKRDTRRCLLNWFQVSVSPCISASLRLPWLCVKATPTRIDVNVAFALIFARGMRPQLHITRPIFFRRELSEMIIA